ncbi:VOC family protein [Polyangium jinanense]|uniref:VOC family protein n=1 Tax=Polyangium jinanense TaxID=2829994 RepID=A0A9X4AV94_9BACT|nr:VOC family protein [Polyangium jinanense]MDC3960584.1 VOC family protein [Polyangium jinanense]MDC3985446.1 VOC family protein [Polyangium jinanense]
MTVKSSYAPGQFCWADLMTTDPAAAKAFYTTLFGWTAEEMPFPGGTYTMFRKREHDVAGLGGQPPEEQSRGIPPHWNVYVSVDDINAVSAKAATLGGNILAPAFDVMESGRMAILADPTGAVFFLWQPQKHIGATLWGEPGAPSWFELQTTDPEKAKAFYTALFGWSTGGDATYTEWIVRGEHVGGMLKIDPSWGPVPPNWGAYFTVENADDTVAKARGLGAKVYMPPKEIGGGGRFAVLSDPQGAVFSVYEEKRR